MHARNGNEKKNYLKWRERFCRNGVTEKETELLEEISVYVYVYVFVVNPFSHSFNGCSNVDVFHHVSNFEPYIEAHRNEVCCLN